MQVMKLKYLSPVYCRYCWRN